MRSIVKAVNLNKYYDQYHALRDINIEVEQGEVMCIIGPSGSGKSTLLRCVNQLEKIDKGGLWVDGELVGYRVVGNKLHEMNEAQIARQRLATGRPTRLSELGELHAHAFSLFLGLLGEALGEQSDPEQVVERQTGDGLLLLRLEPLAAGSHACIRTPGGTFSGRDHLLTVRSSREPA